VRRVLLSTYHSIAEHDDLKMLHDAGFEVLSLGAYLDPRNPGDDKRPPLDIDPIADVIDFVRDTHAAKQAIPDAVFEWLGPDGAIIWHHFPEYLWSQWPRVRQWGGRVIWRTCGQSNGRIEAAAQAYRRTGLERVAYSPAEANLPNYAGHDAVIRFGVDPLEWTGWTGKYPSVTNVTQNLFRRGQATNGAWFGEAIKGLPVNLFGEGSDVIQQGGVPGWYGAGVVTLDQMRWELQHRGAYMYTGTQPAAYTLGFIEAAMTGIPIVSIGPNAWASQQGVDPSWFEAHEFAMGGWSDDPAAAGAFLRNLLMDHDMARDVSTRQRQVALDLFDVNIIHNQ